MAEVADFAIMVHNGAMVDDASTADSGARAYDGQGGDKAAVQDRGGSGNDGARVANGEPTVGGQSGLVQQAFAQLCVTHRCMNPTASGVGRLDGNIDGAAQHPCTSKVDPVVLHNDARWVPPLAEQCVQHDTAVPASTDQL